MPSPVDQSTIRPVPKPVPIEPDAASPFLTPRGHAIVAIDRLREHLRALDAADLIYLGPYLSELIMDAALTLEAANA